MVGRGCILYPTGEAYAAPQIPYSAGKGGTPSPSASQTLHFFQFLRLIPVSHFEKLAYLNPWMGSGHLPDTTLSIINIVQI